MSLKSKIFLESFQGTSQLSVDSFMDLWDRLVAQKLEIQIFLCQKTINPGGPPLPWLPTCVILQTCQFVLKGMAPQRN